MSRKIVSALGDFAATRAAIREPKSSLVAGLNTPRRSSRMFTQTVFRLIASKQLSCRIIAAAKPDQKPIKAIT
jgi:hypothetical protein